MTKHASLEKHASTVKHAFAYTADEQDHLAGLLQWLWLDDGTWSEPAYWRHNAEMARDMGERFAEQDCIEAAEALECGMNHGGETL